MKNAIILQGAGETQESFWLPYTKKELEKRGYKVWLPQLPGIDNPKLKEVLPFILKNGEFNQETVMIGHSAGVPFIFSVLENIDVKIKLAIMVAGLYEPSTNDPKITKWQKDFLQESYDWKKIKAHCQEFVFINAANDPWGCNDKQGKMMSDKLGGTLIINEEGHMGSDLFKQPYKEFPLLISLVEDSLRCPDKK
ncbi:MAG: alpha/beta hydrolase [Microgenomates group bacterium]|jgi:hypothetical protein